MTSSGRSDYTCAMLKCRLPNTRLIIAVACLLIPISSANADWLILQRITDAQGDKRSAYTWVGDGRLRYDDGRIALIANADTNVVHVLDHERRTRMTRRLADSRMPLARAFEPESSGVHRRWPVEQYRLSKDGYEVDVGMTKAVDPLLIERYRSMLSAVGAGTDNRILELPGLPVWTTFTDSSSGRVVGRREVMSVVERSPYTATYRISGDYRTIDTE